MAVAAPPVDQNFFAAFCSQKEALTCLGSAHDPPHR
jgi:hypothetical protein